MLLCARNAFSAVFKLATTPSACFTSLPLACHKAVALSRKLLTSASPLRISAIKARCSAICAAKSFPVSIAFFSAFSLALAAFSWASASVRSATCLAVSKRCF